MKQHNRNTPMRTPKPKGRNRRRLLAVALFGFATTLPLAADTLQEPQDALPGLGVQPVEYFYTGKPYDADTESYTFKYRSYDPELNRWTTADPSGFPDGANNQIYTPNPFSEFDWQGLQTATIEDGTWWFAVNYTVSYDENSNPSLVGNPWLTGITGLSGVPAGYEVNISNGILQNIQKIELENGNWKYTGQLFATIHLSVTFGIKIGPITLGPGYEDSINIASNFEVYE